MLGAVEGGGTKFICEVGEAQDRVVASTRIPTTTPEETLDQVLAFFAPFRLEALGLALFGPLELRPGPTQGTLLTTPKPGWAGVPVAGRLGSALGVPVAVDTDVNAAALAEQRWGAARGADPVLYLTVGTGVGGGLVVHGQPVHGLLHPELGHLLIQTGAAEDSFAGVCLHHGRCLEGLASGPAVRARTGATPEELPDEHPVWELVGRLVGNALAAAVLVCSPQRIVLGGGVGSRRAVLEAARRSLVATLAGYVPRPEVSAEGVASWLVAPGLGERSGVAGAFGLAEQARSAPG